MLALLGINGCDGDTKVELTPVKITIRTCLGDSDGVRFDRDGNAAGPTTCREQVRAAAPPGIENACLVVFDRASGNSNRLRVTLDEGGLRATDANLALAPGTAVDVALFFGAGDYAAAECDALLASDACGANCALKLSAPGMTLNEDTVIDWLDDAGACRAEPGPAFEAERCDDADNDCDGKVDEAFPTLGTRCSAGRGACASTGVLVCGDGDVACTAEPGSATDEVCDEADNDCDGSTDEALVDCCTPGDTQTCGSDVGVCSAGEQSCAAGAWTLCDGVQPVAEVCDGLDNDCDASVDEDAGGGTPCSAGLGGCTREGEMVCVAGEMRCDATAGPPNEELCNDLDDDCNGIIDDVPGVGDSCTAGTGFCEREGRWRCADNGLLCDAQPGAGRAETCDGIDEDCDGEVDENTVQAGQGCVAGVGACVAQGERVCVDGAETCSGVPSDPAPEEVDGVDNDCDGHVDEDLGELCRVGVGVCARRGVFVESDDGPICSAEPGQPAPADVCANAADDDCDGRVDEAGQDCIFEANGCTQPGYLSCEGEPVRCVPIDAPRVRMQEVCNGADDDCDGLVDEQGCGQYIENNCRVWLGWWAENNVPQEPRAQWGECPDQERSDQGARRCTSSMADGRFHSIFPSREIRGREALGVAFSCEDDSAGRWIQRHCAVTLGVVTRGLEAFRPQDCPEAWPRARQGSVRCARTSRDAEFHPIDFGFEFDEIEVMGIAFGCESAEDPRRADAVGGAAQVWLAAKDEGCDDPVAEGSETWGDCPARDDQAGQMRCVGTDDGGDWSLLTLRNPIGRCTQMGVALIRRLAEF